MKVKVIKLHSTHQKKPAAASPATSEFRNKTDDDISRLAFGQIAWVIDEALDLDFLELVDTFRQTLVLDTKRPTVKRRFFSSAEQCPEIRDGLVTAIRDAIAVPFGNDDWNLSDSLTDTTETSGNVEAKRPCHHKVYFSDQSTGSNSLLPDELHILAYMRFLEYDTVGGRLDPHTDGNKICEDTGKKSTHTMLLYLHNCETGGETILFDNTKKQNPPRMIEAVKPLRGRILLFPHPTLHEGAPAVDLPKICLRAEVSLSDTANTDQ